MGNCWLPEFSPFSTILPKRVPRKNKEIYGGKLKFSRSATNTFMNNSVNSYQVVRDHRFIVADNVEQDQLAHT